LFREAATSDLKIELTREGGKPFVEKGSDGGRE
jgi:hypothetical protein